MGKKKKSDAGGEVEEDDEEQEDSKETSPEEEKEMTPDEEPPVLQKKELLDSPKGTPSRKLSLAERRPSSARGDSISELERFLEKPSVPLQAKGPPGPPRIVEIEEK